MDRLENFYLGDTIEAGCDEAGRGCLAGPVVASAVILPVGYDNERLHNHLYIAAEERLELYKDIKHNALSYGIGLVNAKEIDDINILNSSYLAMHRAISKLNITPQHILVDGNRFKQYDNIPFTCVIKGDRKFKSIAAAAILSKCYRDEYMQNLHQEFPEFNWHLNAGYPTKHHREAIGKYGITELHRKSFSLRSNEIEKFAEKIYQSERSQLLANAQIADINQELKKYLAKHPEYLYSLNPRKFEELIASIMEDFGFSVELTKCTRDGGYDIIAYIKNSFTSYITYVECKKYAATNKVGVDVVRSLYGVSNRDSVNKSLIVTTSFFTKDAVNEASSLKGMMDLKDYNNLKEWLKNYTC